MRRTILTILIVVQLLEDVVRNWNRRGESGRNLDGSAIVNSHRTLIVDIKTATNQVSIE
jgi:hypothetical protein